MQSPEPGKWQAFWRSCRAELKVNKIMGYKEDGTCATYPIEESLLNNAKIEEQPIREIAEEFKLW